MVPPGSVDWSRGARGFPYTLRQEPGPTNSLGLVKFMFPNPYAVYLHDTPSKSLFEKSERAFSSGCIRIENPFDFAALLLEGQEDWDRAALECPLGVPGRPRAVPPGKPA